MYGWLLIQRGAREVRAEPSGQGVVGIARPVGASQACTRQPGSGSVTAVRHPSAVTARNEEVFYGGPSGSATRCNVQCERDGAVWKRWRQSRLRLRAWISNSRSWRDARKFVGGSNRSQQAGIEWPVDGYGFTLLSKCNYCICESFGQTSK